MLWLPFLILIALSYVAWWVYTDIMKCTGGRRKPEPVTIEDIEAVLKPFAWLRDYGPLWEPGSKAFWLEPETPDELAGWYIYNRPGDIGIKEAAGLRVEIVPPQPISHGISYGSVYDYMLSDDKYVDYYRGVKNEATSAQNATVFGSQHISGHRYGTQWGLSGAANGILPSCYPGSKGS